MAIPGPYDHAMAEINTAASSVMISLSTMRHADVRDIPRLREILRERLRSYVDLALGLADEAAAR